MNLRYLRNDPTQPNLPAEIIQDYKRYTQSFMGTSGMFITDCSRWVRDICKKYEMSDPQLADEFYRLGANVKITEDNAYLASPQHIGEIMRNAAKRCIRGK